MKERGREEEDWIEWKCERRKEEWREGKERWFKYLYCIRSNGDTWYIRLKKNKKSQKGNSRKKIKGKVNRRANCLFPTHSKINIVWTEKRGKGRRKKRRKRTQLLNSDTKTGLWFSSSEEVEAEVDLDEKKKKKKLKRRKKFWPAVYWYDVMLLV